jgi:hypothetical protein
MNIYLNKFGCKIIDTSDCISVYLTYIDIEKIESYSDWCDNKMYCSAHEERIDCDSFVKKWKFIKKKFSELFEELDVNFNIEIIGYGGRD